MKVLSTNNLGIGYEKPIQKNLALELEKGQLTCLVGKNGTGKTTLLKTLFGEIKSLEGTVYFEEKEISLYSESEMAKQIAVVLTEKIDQVFLTVEEIVGLGRYPYLNFLGKLSSKDQEIIQTSLRITSTIEFSNKLFHQLSDGEKQKVMIAKALTQTTPIIFLDEPIAFLDYPSKLQVLNLLQTIAREENKAILIVLHELDLAIKIADYLWLMSKELPMLTGTPEDLILNGYFEKYFAQDQVYFEQETGEFSLMTNLKKSISIVSDNYTIGHWVKNALVKQGYKIEKNEHYQIYCVDKNIYKLYWEGKEQEVCHSIQELIKRIKINEKG